MARVTGDFNSDVIRTYKGLLDFYYWRGIGVVRSWPRKPVLPRNPAVQAAGVNWRDNSRAISALPLALQVATAEEVRDTAYTWKDAWTTTAYGHGLTWPGPRAASPNVPLSEKVMLVNLVAPGNDNYITWNVDTGSYRTWYGSTFWVPWSTIPFTHYRIVCAGNANQGGQTISIDFCTLDGTFTPAHAPGPALSVPNGYDRRTSGWLSIDNIPAVDGYSGLMMKGSNNTVDLGVNLLQLELTII